MTRDVQPNGRRSPPVEVLGRDTQRLPIILASPHSGRIYPRELVVNSRLDGLSLRRSEDSFVDELFLESSSLGAPLVRALFARAFVDPNREAFELDPRMFADPLPAYVNTRSARVAGGLGTIARVVAHGHEIYARKLRFADAVRRIDRCYRPYHDALSRLIDETRRRFDVCLLIDCHSMPSTGALATAGGGAPGGPVDIVLGDCFGRSCGPQIVDAAELCLSRLGYRVARNAPYAGGYTTRHYGRPANAVHALQIEIKRSLYMDETTLTRRPALTRVAADMARLVEELAAADWTMATVQPHPASPPAVVPARACAGAGRRLPGDGA